MPFDPNLPANFSELSSQQLRNQLNALKELIDQHSGIKVYRAILTQTGTDAPVATVLINTLGTPLTWTRDGNGLYIGTLGAGTFDLAKTFHRVHSSAIVDYGVAVATSRIESGVVMVETIKGGMSDDNQLSNTPIEIIVHG